MNNRVRVVALTAVLILAALVAVPAEAQDFTAPTITEVLDHPNIANTDGPYRITAAVSDNVGVAQVNLLVTLDGGSPQTIQMFSVGTAGALAGRLVDATDQEGVSGASLTFTGGSSDVFSTTTDSDGGFALALPSGEYSATISAFGYVTPSAAHFTVSSGGVTSAGLIQLVPSSGLLGNISGSVRNARNDVAVPEATVELRQGLNVTEGAPIATTTTAGNGSYSFTGLGAGNYTSQVIADGFATVTVVNWVSIGGISLTGQNVPLSPALTEGEVRIVLTWADDAPAPADLDAHLTVPVSGGRDHVYFSSKGQLFSPPNAALDRDDVTWQGPETVTITQRFSGVYRYSVHDYSNRFTPTSTAMSSLSGAVVKVFIGDQEITYRVPTGRAGTVWRVFEMDGATGTITAKNDIFYESDYRNTVSFKLAEGGMPEWIAQDLPEKAVSGKQATAQSYEGFISGQPVDTEIGYAVEAFDGTGNRAVSDSYSFRILDPNAGGPGGVLEAQLVASDGQALDDFGAAVSISDDVVLVGSPKDDTDIGEDAGSAYVYRWSGTSWVEEARLFAADGAVSDEFGISVCVDGDVAIVGSHQDDNGNGLDAGSAYIFRHTDGAWTQEAKVAATVRGDVNYFGESVSVNGDAAIVGSWATNSAGGNDAGAAYIFRHSAGSWTAEASLLASDGAAEDEFGGSVAISGDLAIVGAPFDDNADGTDAGSAYLFRLSGGTWTQEAQVFGSDGGQSQFASSVAISGAAAIVGASENDNAAGDNAGAAYVFRRSGSRWSREVRIAASDAEESDRYGMSVAISGDVAIVGARTPVASGSAYVYTLEGSTWEVAPPLSGERLEFDYFGGAVSVSGDVAVVGASGNQAGGVVTGSVYIINLLDRGPALVTFFPLTPNQALLGGLSGEGDTRYYSFTLDSGSSADLSVVPSDELDAEIFVYAGNSLADLVAGNLVANGSIDARGPGSDETATLSLNGGDHVIAIRSQAGAGTFLLRMGLDSDGSGGGSCVADFDGDGRVAFSDFLEFVGRFGTRVGDSNWDSQYDLNSDNKVDFQDFLEFVSKFGTTC